MGAQVVIGIKVKLSVLTIEYCRDNYRVNTPV
jgi:hypothetical protein